MYRRTKVDAATYGWSLPEGWALYRTDDDQWYLVGTYHVRGWAVLIENDVFAPWTGPGEVVVRFPGDPESVDMAIESDGITLDVLRSVPLGDSRQVLSEWLPRIRTALRPAEAPQPLPARVESEEEYAAVAAEYVRLVTSGERRPVHVMAQASGMSRNTVSARIRRAREMGLLEGEPGKPATKLTGKATELLNAQEESERA